MKLYVWDQWAPDSSDGLAFAIAETEEEARQLVIDHNEFDTSHWGPVQVFDLNQPIAFSVYGGG